MPRWHERKEPVERDPACSLHSIFSWPRKSNGTSTTLLVSARAKGLDLVGLNEPEDEILEEPEEHLAMDMRQ